MSAFLDTLQAQPWFAGVEAIFKSKGVPDPIWESVVGAEDSSLNPYSTNYNPSTQDDSHGLFQINLWGALGSDPARVAAAMGTPQAQATWAADKMAAALSSVPATGTLDDQIAAVEYAGWNGSRAEDPTIKSYYAQITGTNPPSPLDNINFDPLGVNQSQAQTKANAAGLTATLKDPLGVNAWWATASADIQYWMTNIGLTMLAVAVMAGGLAIAAGKDNLERAAAVAA